MGIFWWAGSSSFKQIDEQQPFNVAGIFSSNEKAMEQFIIGGKVKDERIKYLAFGRGPQVPITQVPYNLTLEEVRNMPNTYTVVPVQNNAVLAVFDEVNESNWTVTAFDKDGNLIADKLPGSKARLIESNSFDIVSLKEKRVKTNPEQVDNLMKQLGMKRAQVQETFKMTDGKNKAVDDAVIINQVFQKGDYIYADISLRGNKLSDGDKVRVTYDHTEVYEIDFLHSKNLKLSDDPRIFEVTNATQQPWFGFLVKRRGNNKVAIPFIVTLETETGKYFWRYANVILSL